MSHVAKFFHVDFGGHIPTTWFKLGDLGTQHIDKVLESEASAFYRLIDILR